MMTTENGDGRPMAPAAPASSHGARSVRAPARKRKAAPAPQAAGAFVAYLRVSTDRQAASGLGLEGQQAAVARHLAAHGGELIGEFREAETGTAGKRGAWRAPFDDDAMTLTWRCRPELLRAIRRCQEAGATLLIAKLDRLSRDPIVTSALRLAGVRFLACDNPTANELTIDILAAVATEEARAISERTKAALAAKVARGERSAGRVPFGYRLADGGRLVADPTEQAALAAIPGMAALGWSARRIADLLRADHGVAITHRTVGRILAAGPRRAASAGAR